MLIFGKQNNSLPFVVSMVASVGPGFPGGVHGFLRIRSFHTASEWGHPFFRVVYTEQETIYAVHMCRIWFENL